MTKMSGKCDNFSNNEIYKLNFKLEGFRIAS